MEKRRATDIAGDHTGPYNMCPRYEYHELTAEQIDAIATHAAQKAIELGKAQLYQGVGKHVVNWVFLIVGMFAVGLFVLAAKMGWVKP